MKKLRTEKSNRQKLRTNKKGRRRRRKLKPTIFWLSIIAVPNANGALGGGLVEAEKAFCRPASPR
jgi:hypothetical protein